MNRHDKDDSRQAMSWDMQYYIYHPEMTPCGVEVWGTNENIDSGLRHHIDNCSECQALLSPED